MTSTTLGKVMGGLAVAAMLAGSSVALAQTETTDTGSSTYETTGSTTGTTTPGVPDTGTGSDTTSMILLIVAAIGVIGGVAYLMRGARKSDQPQP